MKKAKPKKRAAGGGRKSSYGERTVSVSMRLPSSSIKWVKALGLGLTRGMVRVIEIAKQSKARCGMSNGSAANMTLRDWFAGQALAGMCKQEANIGEFMDVACDAYEFANAMMRVLNHCSDCGRDLSETGGGTCQTCEVRP